MAPDHPTLLLLSGGPDRPGAAALVARGTEAAQAGESLSVLLSDAGLAWASDPRLEALAAYESVAVGVCSADARDAGWTLDATPPFVAWSALVSWLRDLEPGQRLWTAL